MDRTGTNQLDKLIECRIIAEKANCGAALGLTNKRRLLLVFQFRYYG